ncbi:titin-like [Oreochromis niloticus]|uniref:titin-like n=1 Tax=Oreochromis niloticus TaxID=8128 RepID=UPI000DF116DB|nr:titin-like [Oreochromis niloticus]
MGRSVVYGVLLLLLVANVSFCQAQTVKQYFKVGGTLQLSPQSVSKAISSIVWKYDKNLLAEWVKDAIPLTYYSKFKVRTTLNTDTGVLEIRNMTAADTGLYSVEINNQVQSQVYQTVEVEDVPQPEVEVKPLACDRSSKCELKCYGDITNAEPVTYSWKKDDGEWEDGQDRRDLTSLEKDSVKTFNCRMKNPVSQKESKAFKNPFYQEKPPEPESSPVGAIVGSIILVVIAIVLSVLGFLYKTKEPFKTWVNVNIFRKKTEGKNKATNEEKNESQSLTKVSDGSNTATEQ